MAARVSDTWERVVLTEYCDGRSSRSCQSFKGSRHSVRTTMYIEAEILKGSSQHFMRVMLCVVLFWMSMNRMGDLK